MFKDLRVQIIIEHVFYLYNNIRVFETLAHEEMNKSKTCSTLYPSIIVLYIYLVYLYLFI